MNEPTPTEKIHAAYCRLVGCSLSLTMDRMYWWGHWLARGWGEPELTLVVESLQKRIRNGERNVGALKWSNLIQQAQRFEEELVEAKALKRNAKPAPNPRDLAVGQLRPRTTENPPETATAKPIGTVDWIAELRKAVENPS